MAKRDIWDVLFWIGMLILIGYVMARLFGWINTPEWINLIPLITIIFLAGIVYQKIMGFMDKFDVRTDYFKKNIDKLVERHIELDKRFFALEKQQEIFTKFLTIKRK